MGAWGHDTFDNDTACDWAYGLEHVDDLSLVTEAFSKVLEVETDYLDADLATEALAACEVIARLRGKWGARNPYTETVDQWVSSHQHISVPQSLTLLAIQVIDRVMSPPSELLELWQEGKESSDWYQAVANLRARVIGDV